jgi:solute carrier family 8 (sodium/calcium exchanger)
MSSDICKGGTPLILGGADGVVLPLVHIESQALGAILYLLGLVWCFQGVGIISDIFMNAIEKITSEKRQIIVKSCYSVGDLSPGSADSGRSEPRRRTVKVWNDTVANLTLMALGSSAPEILLSLIELAPNKMKSGALGPSTIVGSAAFNLLIITAVCVSSIPEGESRRIKDITVFAVTASFSVFAYLWLLVILLWSSPDKVTVVEGLLTIIFLPILVTLAYLADIGWFHRAIGRVKGSKILVFSSETTREDYVKMVEQLKAKYPFLPNTDQEMHVLLRYEFPENTSRAVRRMEAMRALGGQKRSSVREKDHLLILGEDVSKGLKPGTAKGKAHPGSVHPADESGQPENKPNAIFEHVSDVYAVSEAAKQVCLTVRRAGNEQTSASCKIRTVPGTAEAHKDYVPIDEQLDFLPTELEKTVRIQIVEDKKPEATEEFYVELIPVPGNGIVGFKKIATVVVLDSDARGKLRFEHDCVSIAEQTHSVTRKIKVERVDGVVGDMKCAYRTEEASAKAGKDFRETSGELEFPEGVMHAFIEVTILPMSSIDKKKEIFRLIIEPCDDDDQAVCFDENTDGGSESGICTITIESDVSRMKAYNACLTAAATRGLLNMDNVEIGWSKWKEQFVEAIYVGGDPESQADAGVTDWIFHFISVPWKVFFASVPPTEFCGGKVCFVCALFMIGVCTALLGDLANLLGCALDIPPSICAITFVALGTSLPDTFASKTAAIQDPIADNSIGNVTGSNSVNVFLGLGLSWSVAAIYWESDGGEFQVDAGSLGPMVAVFCGCAFSCIALLLVRRWALGAELGGPVLMARMSSALLVLLWVAYIVASVVIEETSGETS